MATVLSVISGKGGTGKTSFCANVAMCLCSLGEKVLLIDTDAGLRNLDITLGMSDSLLFSYDDVLNDRATLKQAAAKHPLAPGLRVLTAPALPDGGRLTEQQVKALYAKARPNFSFIIVDCPAGLDEHVLNLSQHADMAIVITTPDPGSLRGAQQSAAELFRREQTKAKLIINRIRISMISSGAAENLDRAIDTVGLPLLGAIPEDEQVMICGNRGNLLGAASEKAAFYAYMNIAKRLLGQRVRLLHGVPGKY